MTAPRTRHFAVFCVHCGFTQAPTIGESSEGHSACLLCGDEGLPRGISPEEDVRLTLELKALSKMLQGPTTEQITATSYSGCWLPQPTEGGLARIWQYALTVDGYSLARDLLGRDCAELANERRHEQRMTGQWRGTFIELRCCLFAEQQRWEPRGRDPQGEELNELERLYQRLHAIMRTGEPSPWSADS